MIVWSCKEVDFRGEHYKNIVADQPTAHLNLPTHQMSLKRNKKNFYVRATMKASDGTRAPNYLWKKTQASDTHFNVRADSDDGFYEKQKVYALHPLHQSAEPEECRITKRYGTVGENIDRYDVTFADGFVARYVGPNGDERTGKRMRIKAAEAQSRKFATIDIQWRFQWKINLPCTDPYVHVSLRDRQDKDKWCEQTLDLSDLFNLARRTQSSVAYEDAVVPSRDPKRFVSGQGDVRMMRHQSSQFESTGTCGANAYQINLKNCNFPHTVAKMWASFEVLPEAESYIRRAGHGRTAPNNLSVGFIATPKARLWDSATSLTQDFWYNYRWPMMGLLALVIAVIIMAIATAGGGI
jgi:hypothetical protein